MEFLKNHYEKIILGLMLLLMASGAGLLVLESSSGQDQLAEYRTLIIGGGGKSPPQEDPEKLRSLLAGGAKPSQTDFVKVHRVFNPLAWYMDTNGNFVPGTKVGVSQLAVHSITPQRLLLEFGGTGGTPERPTLSIGVTREFARAPQERIKKRQSVYLNATNTSDKVAANSSNMLDQGRKLVLLARETAGTPENPEVKCELHEPGKDPLKFTLSKAQGYATVVEYTADIQYMAETGFAWKAARKETPMSFAGDTNIVVDITASNVVVRAVSNDKITTLTLGTAQPVASPAKK